MCHHTAHDLDELALVNRMKRPIMPTSRARVPVYHASTAERPWWPIIADDGPMQYRRWGMGPEGTVFTTPSEEAAHRKGHRCLVPVTGFFEHRMQGGRRVPYYVCFPDENIFCLGGLYEGDTYSILTTSSTGSFVDALSLRMPVIIPRAFEGDWLNPGLSDADMLRFCEASRSVTLEGWPVRGLDATAEEVNVPGVRERVGA